jgi:hypothetical protein
MYRSDYEALVSNPIWKEIVDTLNEVVEGLKKDGMEYDPEAQKVAIARAQGRYKMAEFVLALPEDILREINERDKEENRNA